MINFGIGMILLGLLLFVNYVIVELCKFFPQHIISIIPVMILLDGIVTLGFAFGVKSFITNMDAFVCAIGLSITFALVHKTLYMLRTFKELFKDEIGN